MKVFVASLFGLILFAAGCASTAESPEASAERRNREVVEMVIGKVTDAEWKAARDASTEPNHHVQVSAIIQLRSEQMKHDFNGIATDAHRLTDKASGDRQRQAAEFDAETRRKVAEQLNEEKRRREAESKF
jgi:hypothetical protein